ncbi:MAG: HPr family phosphocarrier protein [Endomicrobiales bacterium]|jgi:phosphotransferase system HPr (HPr) family protein
MVIKKIIVNNPNGVHLRVAADLVKICKHNQAMVTFSCEDCPTADGCSVLSMLMLNARQGTELTISAAGMHAEKTINELVQYFENGSGI